MAHQFASYNNELGAMMKCPTLFALFAEGWGLFLAKQSMPANGIAESFMF
jgi:hypothetical protein